MRPAPNCARPSRAISIRLDHKREQQATTACAETDDDDDGDSHRRVTDTKVDGKKSGKRLLGEAADGRRRWWSTLAGAETERSSSMDRAAPCDRIGRKQ